ncbi:glycerol dehydrogenase [Priestia megaterium]|uniref:glycerol dehydrogenase n=1 Tax=Priestia megaterium TaxID=1404 RepID=UPI0012D984E7|nr:glycerol dehydrogenase [Priestia megaterium]MUL34038.1 Glycerol dehydrogenase [Priestia megaterium]
MVQIFGSIGKYIQGFGELHNIRKHVSWIGDSYLVIASKNRIKDLGEVIKESFGESYKVIFAEFHGESSRKEVKRLMDIAVTEGCMGVIGLGGGKVIDTAKAVGGNLKIPTVIIPTIAASDAATSACACIYNEDGSLDEEVYFEKNPDIILVDTEIIMNAPVRFLVAGMGDTLSTYIGARVCYRGYKDNDFGGKPTETSISIAKLSYDLLMKHGLLAKIACEQKVMTKDLNKIIEANILLSGLGFENNGGSSDHSFYYGFCDLTHRTEHMYHGEYVSLSTLCTLVMEGASKKELDEVFSFCISVGLPVCLEDLKLDNMTEEEFNIVSKGVLRCKSTHNYPFEVTKTDVIAAIKTADVIGKMYKSGGRLL